MTQAAEDQLRVDLAQWFTHNETRARTHLATYFGGEAGQEYTGRWFEPFAHLGDAVRFEATDLLAVETLSVQVPPQAAAQLLLTEADRFNDLLRKVPADVPLWHAGDDVIGPDSPADKLHSELRSLPGVGWVTAGKLMAAKRPNLIPVYDRDVMALVASPRTLFWQAMRNALADANAREVIERICDDAPETTSLLRRVDVVLWMEAQAVATTAEAEKQ